MQMQELGYKIDHIEQYDVTTAEQLINFKGATVYLHNKGDNTIYLSPVTPMILDKSWEIAPSEKIGALSLDEDYVATATATSTLKVMYLKGV